MSEPAANSTAQQPAATETAPDCDPVLTPADAAAALLQAFLEIADAADEQALGQAKANLEKAKQAWTLGWQMGVEGLCVARPSAATATTGAATPAPP